jgi:hypothetical protein
MGTAVNEIGRLWAGRVFGTNIGNLFVELNQSESGISGTLRFLDSAHGIAVYKVSGTFDDQLRLTGQRTQGGLAENHGQLSIEARLTSEGNLRGT